MSKDLIKIDKKIPVTFKPRARLLLQLGDQLIKNESIALVELVKNAYDADAKKVDIYMENINDPQNGIIIIEDDGFGMDVDIVENVWMEPGSDFKSTKFENRELTPRFKRLPIGEKGIGRFGVHKLGNQIELITKKKDAKEVYVNIDWNEFNNYKYLEEVPITIIERDSPQLFKGDKSGTSIVIKNLRKEWTRGIARNVKRTITALISPFDTNDSFKAEFDITDKPEWFEGLLKWEDVKEYALFHFKATICGSEITDFNYEFTPWATMSKLGRRKIGRNDKLVRNFIKLEDNDGALFTLENSHIGPIIFEGYIFDQDPFVMKLGITDKTGFKSYVKNNGGIRVFRDGLRVYDYGEPENDWLNLDQRRFLQPTKKVSNSLILGAVYLKRNDSFDLIEKTNREGFVENHAYEVFRQSLLHVLDIVETLRFSDKKKLREVYGPTAKSEPLLHILGELKDYIDHKVKDNEVRKEITKYLVKIEEDYIKINENLLKAAGAGLSMSVVIHEVEKIIREVQKVLLKEKASERLVKLVKHLSSLIDGYASIIRKSTQTNEDIREILDQALFNTEYRLDSHKINVICDYKKYNGKTKSKLARGLLLGCLMNVIDNSIYWLEKSNKSAKKIYFNITNDEEGFINIIVADNGTGFLLPTEEITEPFVSAKPGGMGLGLHIANEVMLAQGGKLSFPEWGDFEIPQEFKDGAIIAFGIKNK